MEVVFYIVCALLPIILVAVVIWLYIDHDKYFGDSEPFNPARPMPRIPAPPKE
jgi:hypothetical protein